MPPPAEQTRGTDIEHILLVGHHGVVRQAASLLMDREDDLEVVAQAASVAEVREKMAQGGIDAAVVDVPLPDGGADELVGELRRAAPPVPVLVLTPEGDQEASEAFLNSGAREVLSKGCAFAELLAAVRRLGNHA